VAYVSNSGTQDIHSEASGTETEPVIEVVGAVDAVEPASKSKWYRWRKDGRALMAYLLDSEVHTFAFSVAANAILSFIPFVVLLYTLSKRIFYSPTMAKITGDKLIGDKVIDDMVRYFFPSNQPFIAHALAGRAMGHGVQVLSLLMIVVACTGIFLPLEVALNQAWGVTKSRNYLSNQVVAFGLALGMVALGMGCVLTFIFFSHTDNFVFNGISWMFLAVSTGVASILFFFSIYWLLPNRKVPWRPVLRTSIYTGIIWLGAKYLFMAFLPHLDLESLYGPFQVSVGLLFWAYASGLILFAGAQFSVSRMAVAGPVE
jgi:YihY family inner membrane protein